MNVKVTSQGDSSVRYSAWDTGLSRDENSRANTAGVLGKPGNQQLLQKWELTVWGSGREAGFPGPRPRNCPSGLQEGPARASGPVGIRVDPETSGLAAPLFPDVLLKLLALWEQEGVGGTPVLSWREKAQGPG